MSSLTFIITTISIMFVVAISCGYASYRMIDNPTPGDDETCMMLGITAIMCSFIGTILTIVTGVALTNM